MGLGPEAYRSPKKPEAENPSGTTKQSPISAVKLRS
jgi:hypothetical protein